MGGGKTQSVDFRSMISLVLCTSLNVQDRMVKLSSVFDTLTYWNLETLPTSDDTVVMAMDWPELAEAVSHFSSLFLLFTVTKINLT